MSDDPVHNHPDMAWDMAHEWLDFKGAATTVKTPGAYWTYYRCKGCGIIRETKEAGKCSGVLRYRQPLPPPPNSKE